MMLPDQKQERIRPRYLLSVWGWLTWLLIALLFYLIISRVIIPWWYTPVPTTPPVTPNSNTERRI